MWHELLDLRRRKCEMVKSRPASWRGGRQAKIGPAGSVRGGGASEEGKQGSLSGILCSGLVCLAGVRWGSALSICLSGWCAHLASGAGSGCGAERIKLIGLHAECLTFT